MSLDKINKIKDEDPEIQDNNKLSNLLIDNKFKIQNLFWILIFTTIMMNFDTGVFPPVLDKIIADLGVRND